MANDLIQRLNMDMIFYFKDRENLSIFMTYSDFMENVFDYMSEEEKNEYCFNTMNGEYLGQYVEKCFECCQVFGYAPKTISEKPYKLLIQ